MIEACHQASEHTLAVFAGHDTDVFPEDRRKNLTPISPQAQPSGQTSRQNSALALSKQLNVGIL